jgi:ubiquinone/menaquinone biosynthesis C-methylase UbiE
VIGVEYAWEPASFARRRFGVDVAQANAQQLPFPDALFDAAVSFETVEHVPDPEEFVAELSRTLKAEATLLLSTPNQLLSDGSNPYHIKEFSLSELSTLLSDNGLSIVSVHGQHWRFAARWMEQIWGIRKLLHEITRSPSIRRARIPGWAPHYWIVLARKRASFEP